MWPSVVFNLCLALLLAAYLFRAVRRFERRTDAIIARIEAADVAEQQAFDRARDEIRDSMRARVDAMIAELEWRTPASITAHPGHGGILGAVTLQATGAAALGGTQLLTEDKLRSLPRWVQVAIAARCARRVLPRLKRVWSNVPLPHLKTLEDLIRLSEQAAANAHADVAVAYAAYADAGAYADAYSANDIDTDAQIIPAAVTHAVAALIPGRALTAAFAATASAFGFIHARAAVIRDLEIAFGLVSANRWTKSSTVPPSVFGPLWPEGAPEDWSKPEPPVTEFVLEFDVPDDMPTADAVELAKELSATLCELDLGAGGHGLAIQPPFEITAPVRTNVRA